MTVQTVKDLIKELSKFDGNMKLIGLNSSGDERPVAIYPSGGEDGDEIKLIVDTD